MKCPLCNAPNSDSAANCSACGSALSGAASATVTQALPAGTRLQGGAYIIDRVLGQGGFGITYLAEDTRLGRLTALKEFFPDSCLRQQITVQPTGRLTAADHRAACEKFLNEARVLARFQHPAIVNVYSSFEENNTAYMAMEYLKGQTLLQLVEKNRVLPEGEAVRYIEQVGAALEVVHEAKLVHRDVKPENAIVCDNQRVVLIDFGLNKEFQNTAGLGTQRFSNTTAFVTAGYAPPEQYGKQLQPGTYSDVYALGATLYHLLTGTVPIEALDRLQGVTLPPPHSVQTGISRIVSDAVMWAMEIRVADRPQTVREFTTALRSTKTSPTTSPKGGSGSRAPQRNAAPAPTPQAAGRNPHLPRMRQILAELAGPPSTPASTHDARLQEIEAGLSGLTGLDSGTMQCPACQTVTLVQVTGQPTGQCPLCRTGRLQKRPLDNEKCPVCRESNLMEHSGSHIFCPICRLTPLKEERRKRFGMALDIWLVCPYCKAEWDALMGGKAKLMSFQDDPHGVGAQHQGHTLPLDEWRRLSTRGSRCSVCCKCSAQFDQADENRLKLVSFQDDPHGVGRQYCGQTFFRAAWAKLAAGLPIGAGNLGCTHCSADFDYHPAKRTLTLLKCDPQYAWAQAWRGHHFPIQRWYFALAGKQSPSLGWLCSGCKTEFDNQGNNLKLVRTSANQLAAQLNQVHSVEDWQRVARQLATVAQEKLLREELRRLQAARQHEQAQLQKNRQQQHQRLEDELTQLLKQSCLDGFIALNISTADLPIQNGEVVRWRSPAQMFRQRSRQGYVYWEQEKNGSIVVTDQRLYLADSMIEPWWRWLGKLKAVEMSYQSGQPMLSIHFTGLKKPIGFLVSEMRVNATVEGQARMVILTAQDLVQLLKQLSGAAA